jgi:hypothetical protein
MPEPLSERLSRLTPDGSGLDRDGLLFEAGRLAARPNRWWQALAATLAVAQVLTLVLLWPRAAPPPSGPVVLPTPATPVEPPYAPAPQDSELLMLNQRLLDGKTDSLLPPVSIERLAPNEPPLHVFTAPSSLMN